MSESAIEDSGDKLRRNLVMVSTAVLVGAFLDVQVSATAKLLGVAEIQNLTPWKIWLVLGIALVYFILRYRFDGLTEKLATKARAGFSAIARPMVVSYVNRAVKSTLIYGRPNKRLAVEGLQNAIRERSDSYSRTSTYRPLNPSKPVSLSLTGDLRGQLWKGGLLFEFGVAPLATTANGGTGFEYVDYEIPRLVRGVISLFAFLRLLTYTKVGVDLLFPYFVGLLALATCVWKASKPLLSVVYAALIVLLQR